MRKHLLVYLLTFLVLAGSSVALVKADNTKVSEPQVTTSTEGNVTTTVETKETKYYKDENKTDLDYTITVETKTVEDTAKQLSTVTTTETKTDASGKVMDGYPKVDTKEKGLGLIPDSVNMDLAFKDKTMPSGFRGGDPDSTQIHLLEDVPYEKHEHTVIYSGGKGESASNVTNGSNAVFASEPTIDWTVTLVDENGEPVQDYKDPDDPTSCGDFGNTNLASNGGAIKTPGGYNIGNGGASSVSTDDGTKRVTSQQTCSCIVHDCTAPDVWIAFKEKAGMVSSTKQEKLGDDIIARKGAPADEKELASEETSYICVDEGAKRNKNPMLDGESGRTFRVTKSGPMFNEDGKPTYFCKDNNPAGLSDSTKFLMVNKFVDGEGGGIFVRRNVPFNFEMVAVDNYEGRKTLLQCKKAYIETKDHEIIDVDKDEGEYIFRKPNYPREEYKDQPDYYFVAIATDRCMDKTNTEDTDINKKGNTTTIKVPVYVLNTGSSFESTSR